MKHELDKMMSLIKDHKTGNGGVTNSFMRKELELFAKNYHEEQCNITNSLELKVEYLQNEIIRLKEFTGLDQFLTK